MIISAAFGRVSKIESKIRSATTYNGAVHVTENSLISFQVGIKTKTAYWSSHEYGLRYRSVIGDRIGIFVRGYEESATNED